MVLPPVTNRTYCLPQKDDKSGLPKLESHEATSNAVFIVGANGAGKSKLGAWMEQQNSLQTHRIGGQRDLNFQQNIPLKCFDEAESLVRFGYAGDDTYYRQSKIMRWNNNATTTKLLDDFNNVLAALIASHNNAATEYLENCKEATRQDIPLPSVITTNVDMLFRIWEKVMPHRKLKLHDSRFITEHDANGIDYPANQMSDGERSVLYLAAQVLCIPDGVSLIIDEPEIHLHKSIMSNLWRALEECKPDCLFIYITHDTQFVAQHKNADIIWVKSYDGSNWEWEKLKDVDLPNELLLEILGSRKNVLFVEGEKNSYDSKLYSRLYLNHHVIPCGSCGQVIARTKAFKNAEVLHHCSVCGIIDRDYRVEHEIEALEKDNIFVLSVAEVENLFLVEELLSYFTTHKKFKEKERAEILKLIKDDIIDNYYSGAMEAQVCQSVIAQLKYKLSKIDIKANDKEKTSDVLRAVLDDAHSDFESLYTEEQEKYASVLNRRDYKEVLRIFNEKHLLPKITKHFNDKKEEYYRIILEALCDNDREKIVAALTPYLPHQIEIPKTI